MPETFDNEWINRRKMLAISMSAAAGVAGCQGKEDVQLQPSAPRRDVPLRVALVGGPSDAEAIARGWASVTEQALKIELIPSGRTSHSASAGGGLGSKLIELAKKCDVLIHPVLAVADLMAAEATVPIPADEFSAIEQELGQVHPAVRNGAATYAGEIVATPLGAQLPALLASDEVSDLESWEDYDGWVQGLSGAAAEPLAPGWAGTMFLWRAASTIETGWLFAREGLAPLIDTEPYVDVLSNMKRTAARYKTKNRLTPREIWSQLLGGELRGAIGMRMTRDDELQLTAANLPGAAGANRVLLDPFSPVVSISAACRQTGASKDLANWLSGGEGSENVRQQVAGMNSIRAQRVDSAQSEQQQSNAYDTWLRKRLQTPVALPSLQLLSAGEYYAVLDQQVGECLDGNSTPAEALGRVSEQWQELTIAAGLSKQERAWRRAQGMRA